RRRLRGEHGRLDSLSVRAGRPRLGRTAWRRGTAFWFEPPVCSAVLRTRERCLADTGCSRPAPRTPSPRLTLPRRGSHPCGVERDLVRFAQDASALVELRLLL